MLRYIKQIAFVAACVPLIGVAFGQFAHAGETKSRKQTYSEEQFLNTFGGKSRKEVLDKLGAPGKKEQSVKPMGADNMVTRVGGGTDKSKSASVNIEMWYYGSIVTYDGKRTYKSTEITFVNDRVQNIGFFNNR